LRKYLTLVSTAAGQTAASCARNFVASDGPVNV